MYILYSIKVNIFIYVYMTDFELINGANYRSVVRFVVAFAVRDSG